MEKNFAAYVFNFFKSIYAGMGITLWYFVHPGEVITMQYPDEKWEMPPRFRGFHSVAFEGKEACIGCLQCQRGCSEHSIQIKASMGEDKKRKIDEFYVNMATCSFCGNCQEVCPVKAIKLGSGYEGSVWDKRNLMLDKEKLRRAPIFNLPKPAEPGKAEPVKPEAAKPEVAKSDVAKSEAAKAGVAKSEAAKSEAAKPEVAKSEAAKPDAAKAEVAKSEAAKPEVTKSEAAKSEVAKSEAAKPNASKRKGKKAQHGVKHD